MNITKQEFLLLEIYLQKIIKEIQNLENKQSEFIESMTQSKHHIIYEELRDAVFEFLTTSIKSLDIEDLDYILYDYQNYVVNQNMFLDLKSLEEKDPDSYSSLKVKVKYGHININSNKLNTEEKKEGEIIKIPSYNSEDGQKIKDYYIKINSLEELLNQHEFKIID